MSAITQHQYKATFILDTRGVEGGADEIVGRLKTAIESIGGTVQDIRDLGLRDFVRVTDRNFPSGHYVQITFTGEGDCNGALTEKLRLDRAVYRIFAEKLD